MGRQHAAEQTACPQLHLYFEKCYGPHVGPVGIFRIEKVIATLYFKKKCSSAQQNTDAVNCNVSWERLAR